MTMENKTHSKLAALRCWLSRLVSGFYRAEIYEGFGIGMTWGNYENVENDEIYFHGPHTFRISITVFKWIFGYEVHANVERDNGAKRS